MEATRAVGTRPRVDEVRRVEEADVELVEPVGQRAALEEEVRRAGASHVAPDLAALTLPG